MKTDKEQPMAYLKVGEQQIELIQKEIHGYTHEYLMAFKGGNKQQMKICTCYIQAFNKVLRIISEGEPI